MSLVIAVKNDNRIILGADKQITWGFDKKSHNGTKIWKTQINSHDYYCMGAVGSARASQIIAEDSNFMKLLNFGDEEFPQGFATIGLPRAIYEILKENGIEEDLNDDHSKHVGLPCSFFFAYHDKCWLINRDMTVEEVEDYAAIGSGGDRAETSMDTAVYCYGETQPYKLITNAIDLVAERTLYVDHEIDFIATEVRETDGLAILDATDPEAAKAARAKIKELKDAAKEAKKKEKEEAQKKKEKELAKQEKKKQKLLESASPKDANIEEAN